MNPKKYEEFLRRANNRRLRAIARQARRQGNTVSPAQPTQPVIAKRKKCGSCGKSSAQFRNDIATPISKTIPLANKPPMVMPKR